MEIARAAWKVVLFGLVNQRKELQVSFSNFCVLLDEWLPALDALDMPVSRSLLPLSGAAINSNPSYVDQVVDLRALDVWRGRFIDSLFNRFVGQAKKDGRRMPSLQVERCPLKR